MASKKRIDVLLVERGLVKTRALAQRMVMAGQVRVNDQVMLKPSTKIEGGANLTLDEGPRYVSRGGEKLEGALDDFQIDVTELTCVDVGSSTGGFTDCLLQHGAKKIYAIDVGKGILHWKLRQDARVEVMEQTNARYVEKLSEAVELVTIDASFISLKVLLPVAKNWFGEEGGQVIALIKPQFEAGRSIAAKGKGVIRDPEVHRQVLEGVLGFAEEQGFGVRGLTRSLLVGPKGNVEFLGWLEYPHKENIIIEELVSSIIVQAESD